MLRQHHQESLKEGFFMINYVPVRIVLLKTSCIFTKDEVAYLRNRTKGCMGAFFISIGRFHKRGILYLK